MFLRMVGEYGPRCSYLNYSEHFIKWQNFRLVQIESSIADDK